MTSYTEAGLVTDDPVVAAMFLGDPNKGYIYRIHSNAFSAYGDRFDIGRDGWVEVVTVPWPLVREVIAPVEGEGNVWDFPEKPEWEELTINSHFHYSRNFGSYHKRILNIVTTRAELRELVERSRGKE